MKPRIALQLWSVREACEADFIETLVNIKVQGYDGVEFAGYYGYSAEKIKRTLEQLDLAVAASHIPYEKLLEKPTEIFLFEKTIGNQRIVVPYASFKTQAEWLDFMRKINTLAVEAAKYDLEIYYHNHAHEFVEIPDIDVLDLWTEVAPEVKLEVDLYWLAFAGKEVLSWLKIHQAAIGLLHIKDMQADPKESTELGNGILPIKDYVTWAQEMALPWLIVEQEAFQAYQPIEASAKNYQAVVKIMD
ncbi:MULTISPECIES: sugar phosphate isomerase/epimerase [unclassified Enterococcus]|uniref:sugar phosphate isomerase/epimerase family protein n=1 Tax=unclassified Enterococcus TaxID=2608891 RepID=UPI0015521D90|nr:MULTISPECIES: sugar phosphate isomerase/epimerase [unclassified Enterococcus]MBS7577373.1 sugar phosphate isomerase/epimerase [Enterococcus sp. MMGLQ5-2]MBS7584780.1 sugar phosphate isomerase/epimerase [Enterococcus sp. MMGLQ5-1]NPD12635.1 sugar phosphate isomerase/epimerase [Enterococcus sp. MMGLQ5-1]NPD37207.1 sugar phosphate isomerase/epimerase [Enterococcus sp. MMGLQ5-2]